jgi:hypothetical protein
MVNERGLADPGPGNDCNDVDILVCPCTIQKSDVFLPTKRSLPVTGSLATEIFFGPKLSDSLRVTADKWLGGVFRKLCRVILRRESIAFVMVGITLNSSAGF